MNILLPLYKKWSEMILAGEKPLEFRTRLPKDFEVGTTIYLYETLKNGGCGRVVGECRVNQILNVQNKAGKWPTFGAYPFIDYYYEHVACDKEKAEHLRRIKEQFADKFPRYKYGFILQYAFSEDNLNNILQNGEPIDTWKIMDIKKVHKILDDIELGNKAIEECDKWLTKIGFYNEMEESYYKYGIELTNIVRYPTPKSLSDFTDRHGMPIKKAPQSFQYVNE